MKLKNVELKIELRLRGQTLSGNKNNIWERLQKALADKIPVGFEKEKTKTKAADGVEIYQWGKYFQHRNIGVH